MMDDYDGLLDGERSYNEWMRWKQFWHRFFTPLLDGAFSDAYAQVLREMQSGDIAEHPELDAFFADAIRNRGPVRVSEVAAE